MGLRLDGGTQVSNALAQQAETMETERAQWQSNIASFTKQVAALNKRCRVLWDDASESAERSKNGVLDL